MNTQTNTRISPRTGKPMRPYVRQQKPAPAGRLATFPLTPAATMLLSPSLRGLLIPYADAHGKEVLLPYGEQVPEDYVPRLLVSPAIASAMLSIGNKQLYELLNAGEIDSLLIGRSRRIPVLSLMTFISQRLQRAS